MSDGGCSDCSECCDCCCSEDCFECIGAACSCLCDDDDDCCKKKESDEKKNGEQANSGLNSVHNHYGSIITKQPTSELTSSNLDVQESKNDHSGSIADRIMACCYDAQNSDHDFVSETHDNVCNSQTANSSRVVNHCGDGAPGDTGDNGGVNHCGCVSGGTGDSGGNGGGDCASDGGSDCGGSGGDD